MGNQAGRTKNASLPTFQAQQTDQQLVRPQTHFPSAARPRLPDTAQAYKIQRETHFWLRSVTCGPCCVRTEEGRKSLEDVRFAMVIVKNVWRGCWQGPS